MEEKTPNVTQHDHHKNDSTNNNNKPNNRDQFKGLFSLLFNIVIPAFILQKLSNLFGPQGPLIALITALIFPLSYGFYDYRTSKKNSVLAIIGVVNILATGGLALFKFQGIWFAVKEAFIPLVIGIAVLVSSFSQKPLIHMLIYNENLMNVDLVKEKLRENGNVALFEKLLQVSTMLLAGSFFISALLNFFLAQHIFIDIDQSFSAAEKSIILNQQIAQMTWKSYFVIALPSLVITSGIIFYLIKGVKKLTGLDFTQVLKT